MPNSQKAAKGGRISKPLMVMIIATTLLIIFIVVALLFEPQASIPEFNIYDQNGDWDAQAQGKIAVFDDTIYPGLDGEYEFKIKNVSDTKLSYGFRLTEYLNNTNFDAKSFMMYRLKMDGVPLGDYSWQRVGFDYSEMEIEAGSEHRMTLEWWWPFDENDENDTLIGRTGGSLSVHIFIWAEVVEDVEW